MSVGHQRLKNIPKTLRWRQVVELLDDGGSVGEIATLSAQAIDKALSRATRDPALTEVVYLLALLPGAARQHDTVRALGGIGIDAGSEPSLLDILAGLERAVDREARMRGGRTDLGEIAQLAAANSITTLIAPTLPGLFSTTATDVRSALARLDTPDQFARLSRTFFSELVQRSLNYYLSREYAKHLGRGEAFATLADQETFRDALSVHCYQTALIVERYSADWFSKAKFEGGITRARASTLARAALSKLRKELSHRSDPDG